MSAVFCSFNVKADEFSVAFFEAVEKFISVQSNDLMPASKQKGTALSLAFCRLLVNSYPFCTQQKFLGVIIKKCLLNTPQNTILSNFQ